MLLLLLAQPPSGGPIPVPPSGGGTTGTPIPTLSATQLAAQAYQGDILSRLQFLMPNGWFPVDASS